MSESIIIIENNPVIQKQAVDLLENEGLDTWYARDIESALVLMGKISTGLILVSLTLQKMDGTTLTKILKSDNNTSNIICLALVEQKNDSLNIHSSGMDGYISKPINEMTFASEVKSYFKC